MALSTLGKHKEALESLNKARNLVNTDDREERAWYSAAMAETLAHTGRPDEAIAFYDDWYRIGRPAERDYALDQIRSLGG